MAHYIGTVEFAQTNELNTIGGNRNSINADNGLPTISDAAEKASGSVRRRANFTKYGARIEPPTDFGIQYPLDNRYAFFAKGREIASRSHVHLFSAKEKQILASYESQDYLPSHSDAYKQYIRRRARSSRTMSTLLSLEYDRWLTMAFIGVSIGLVGFLLHQLIDTINDVKWQLTRSFASQNQLFEAWLVTTCYSLAFVFFSSCVVTYFRPSAAGSGIPELIGFLNGSLIRHIFNIKTLLVKFFSCIAAVGSGLPVGPEGPMIHIGSLVGAGISQFKSDTLHFSLPLFRHFRNAQDRRNFIQAGAAAGVSTAFHAPVGGLLFAMEEVSSFWNLKLTWQIFFCCMTATFTTALFNSAFQHFNYNGKFGLFTEEGYVMFPINVSLSLSVVAFLPAIVLGIIGGLLGALFVFLHLKVARARFYVLAHIKSNKFKNIAKVVECLIISALMSSFCILLPSVWPCTVDSRNGNSTSVRHVENSTEAMKFEQLTCPNGSYNEMATLMWHTAADTIGQLWSRDTYARLQGGAICTLLLFNFLGSAWASSASLSSGLVLPMLLIGSLYGRLVGILATDIIGAKVVKTDPMFYWADPGVMALIGGASFFAGVTRCTMSLTVIMIELTSDVQFLLPIMVAVMVAKWVGDFLTHPIYHANLEVKCIPYLANDPEVYFDDQPLNLELFSARHVMSSPAVTLRLREMVSHIAHLLLDTNHGGFPVVKKINDEEVFIGSITRLELAVLLMRPDLFIDEADDSIQQDLDDVDDYGPSVEEDRPLAVEFEQTNIDKLDNPADVESTLQMYADDPTYHRKYIRLGPYINKSAMSVERNFSLQRTYIIFRALGLRHLFVTDELNRVMGVITRKDLMTSTMQERLAQQVHQLLIAHAVVPRSSDNGLTSNATAQPARQNSLATSSLSNEKTTTVGDASTSASGVIVGLEQDKSRSASNMFLSSFGEEERRRGELMLELNEQSGSQ